MQKLLGYIFLLVLLAGCGQVNQEKLTVRDRYEPYIVNMGGFNKNNIIDFKKRINDNRLLEFEIIFKSSTDQNVFYKIDWLDKDGFTLRDALNDDYQSIYLNKNREFILKKLSSNKNARSVRIYLLKK